MTIKDFFQGILAAIFVLIAVSTPYWVTFLFFYINRF